MSEEFIVTDEMLHAYADGELDAVYCERMTQYLIDHPDKAAEMGAWQEQKKSLAQCFDPVLQEELPPEIASLFEEETVAPVSAHVEPASIWQSWGRPLLAASVILTVGGALGWNAARLYQPQLAPVTALVSPVQNALSAHLVYAADTARPVEITADQEAGLVGWLSARLDRPLKAPDFSATGFSLMGGRLLYENSNAAAQFMYENPEGQRISLYVAITSEDAASGQSQETSFQIVDTGAATSLYWQDDPFLFAITGDLDRALLLEVAESAYNQLRL